MSQQDQLNAMERQQDVTQWSSTALFTATNGVFLIALFSGLSGRILESSALYMGFGLTGLVICLVWLIVTVRAELFAIEWLYRTLRLQRDYGVPSEYSIWQDYGRNPNEKKPPISSSIASLVLIIVFAVIWSLSTIWGAWTSGVFLLLLIAVLAITTVTTVSIIDLTLRRSHLKGVKQRLGLQ